MAATVDRPIHLYPVADDAAVAVGASWREHLNGALEAVEGVGLTIDRDVDALVVVVSAAFASLHGKGRNRRRRAARCGFREMR